MKSQGAVRWPAVLAVVGVLSVPVARGGETRVDPAIPRNVKVGARATGMADSFTGVANDATAVWWNPAGISSIGEPGKEQGYQIRPEITLCMGTKGQFKEEEKGENPFDIIPRYLSFIFPIGEDLAAGVALLKFFDLNMEMHRRDDFNYTDMESTDIWYRAALALSYTIYPKERGTTGLFSSIGLGASVDLGIRHYTQKVDSSLLQAEMLEEKDEMKTGVGFSVSLLPEVYCTPDGRGRLRVGVTYHFPIDQTIEGSLTGPPDKEIKKNHAPDVLTFGASYRHILPGEYAHLIMGAIEHQRMRSGRVIDEPEHYGARSFSIALEYTRQLAKTEGEPPMGSIRAGMLFSHQDDVEELPGGEQDADITIPSAGVGLVYGHFQFDFGIQFGDKDQALQHWLASLSYAF